MRQYIGARLIKALPECPQKEKEMGVCCIEEIDVVEDKVLACNLVSNCDLVMGDALVNGQGEVFFFMAASNADGITSTLMEAKTGLTYPKHKIDEFIRVKKFESEAVHFLDYSEDSDVKDQFKVIQSHGGYMLLGSTSKGLIFVAPEADVDGFIRGEYQARLKKHAEQQVKRQELKKREILKSVLRQTEPVMLKRAPFNYDSLSADEAFVSPDSIAFGSHLRESSHIQQLFKETNGPRELRMQFITSKFIEILMKKQLEFVDAMTIVRSAERIFHGEKTIGYIKLLPGQKITVVGDIHGQFNDLLRIFKNLGWPSDTKIYLFNGDIVDRGDFSMECLLMLYVLKITFPRSVFINRGNHETDHCEACSFERDCLEFDDSSTFYDACLEGFKALPIAHVINERIYVVHGGIRADYNIKKLSELDRFDLTEEIFDFIYVSLWDDSSETTGLNANNSRGLRSRRFGPDVTESFLQLNGFDLLIRSHTFIKEGVQYSQGGKCCTVFSAPDYCGMGNRAAVITYDDELNPEFSYFVSRP